MNEAASGEQPPAEKLERARRDPLSSPALGTASSDLIEPCGVREPLPAIPPPAPEGALALAFSGGGFRATLAALGVLRFLADAGLLQRVRYVSSVSGGSLANGLLAGHWRELEQESFSAEALDQIVVEPELTGPNGAPMAVTSFAFRKRSSTTWMISSKPAGRCSRAAMQMSG